MLRKQTYIESDNMRETFREKSFRQDINIQYTDAGGNKARWTKNQSELAGEICGIVDVYMAEGYCLTVRQLYYQLVARDLIPNAMDVYKRVCTFITDLKYIGLIDWNAIEDRGRPTTRPSQWEDINGLIKSALNSYRLPRWDDQDYYIEVYCEKQAMESVLQPIAAKYHVYFGVNKGYSSSSAMYSIAKRVEEQINLDKEVIMLYLGDHDPSGLDMVRDIQKRVCEFLRLEVDNDLFNVRQIALNQEQIKLYNPPSNPARITDPRAKWYLKQFGKRSWELDALEPKVLAQITEDAILEYLDEDKYNEWIEREQEEAEKLRKFGESIKKGKG